MGCQTINNNSFNGHKTCASRSRPWLRIVAGIFVALFASAAPRITTVVELKVSSTRFFDRQEGWAIGAGPSLLRTVDGGSSWKPVKIIIHGRDTGAEIRGTYFVSARAAWVKLARGNGLDERLAVALEFVSTHDGGVTWEEEALPGVAWFFDSLSATDEPKGPLWLGGQVSQERDAPAEEMECPQRVTGFTWIPTIYFRPAPGSNWEEQRLPVQNGCPVSMIRFLDKLRGVAIAGSAILFSEDSGRHWQRGTIHSSKKINTVVSLQLRGRQGWIGCDGGEILHTVDGGQHWQEIVKSGAIWSKAKGFGSWGTVYFTSAQTGFTLGGAGELFGTTDRGKTWSRVELPERIVNVSCAENVCWLASEGKLYRLEAE